jgi:hypothetical protein
MTDFQDLTEAIVAFRDRRDWQQFHSLKNLAAGLSIAAAELQEVLLWKSDREVQALAQSCSGRGRLSFARPWFRNLLGTAYPTAKYGFPSSGGCAAKITIAVTVLPFNLTYVNRYSGGPAGASR